MRVRNINLGEGIPKVCVPLVGKTLPELLEEAALAREAGADLAEWRADHLAEPAGAAELLGPLRAALGELPLLFTFRTAAEGGAREIPSAAYEKLLLEAAASGCVDLVDVELFRGEDLCRKVINFTRGRQAVVLSSHDFAATPGREVLEERLERMHALGADIPKLAVTPHSPEDVLTLLAATLAFRQKHPGCPVITISMGELGMLSRVAGACFGSCLTFGAVRSASAPGQPAAAELKAALRMLGGGEVNGGRDLGQL